MPPARRQKSKDSKAQEERIQSAIADLQDGKLSSARQAALKYDVPSTTLLNRMKGVKSRSQTWANCHRLSLEDEESLSRWIISVTEQHETAPSRSQIEEKANAILANRSNTPNVTVGEKWVYNYLQRHEELRPIYPRRIYSRRIYTAVVGNASAETGSRSNNPNRETGQRGNQRNTLPPPIRSPTHLDVETSDSFNRLEKLLSTFKELAMKETDAGSASMQTTINSLIKGCEMILESGYTLVKETQDLRAALAEMRLSLLGPKIGMPLEIRVAVAKLGHPKLHCMAMTGHDNSKVRCEHGLLIFDIIPWTLAWKHWKEQEYLTQVFIQYYHQINGVELARQRIRARVRNNAHEKNTRKARISWCSGGFKPPCFHDNYYLALNTPMWILASGKRDQSRYE